MSSQSSIFPGFITIGDRDQDLIFFRNGQGSFKNIMEDMDKEDYRKPSGDEGEVVFSQQEEGAAITGPYGPRMDRQKENGWLEDTEPYHGARPRMIDVNQLVDNVLGATMSTAGQDLDFRDTPAPTLPPEQQIRQEGGIQTPPRREPRRDGGQRSKGPG